jgi:ribosomal protein L37AE/L43A
MPKHPRGGPDFNQLEFEDGEIQTTRMLRVVTVVSGTIFSLSCPVCGLETEIEEPENGQLWDCQECGETLKIKIKF